MFPYEWLPYIRDSCKAVAGHTGSHPGSCNDTSPDRGAGQTVLSLPGSPQWTPPNTSIRRNDQQHAIKTVEEGQEFLKHAGSKLLRAYAVELQKY